MIILMHQHSKSSIPVILRMNARLSFINMDWLRNSMLLSTSWQFSSPKSLYHHSIRTFASIIDLYDPACEFYILTFSIQYDFLWFEVSRYHWYLSWYSCRSTSSWIWCNHESSAFGSPIEWALSHRLHPRAAQRHLFDDEGEYYQCWWISRKWCIDWYPSRIQSFTGSFGAQ